MTLEKIIVDTSSFYYRLHASADTAPAMFDLAYKTFTEDWLSKAKKICLCFDPLPTNVNEVLSDDEPSKDHKTYRQTINEEYKLNRKEQIKVAKSNKQKKTFSLNTFQEKQSSTKLQDLQLKTNTLLLLYKEFIQAKYDGKIEVYHSQKYEADDYCDQLTKDCLRTILVTNDMDWSRYLSRDCSICNKGLSIESNLYTAEDFAKDKGYKPNVTTVTLMKAFFGDKSDNITGSFMLPKIKVYRSVANKVKEAILSYQEHDNLYQARLDILGQKNAFEEPLKSLAETLTDKGYSTIISTTLNNVDIIDTLIHNEADLNDCYVRLSIDYDSGNAISSKKIVFNTF